VASADNCDAGTVFLPETGMCGIQDPSCGGGNATFAGIMSQGQMMINVQNEHYVDRVQVDPNRIALAITGTELPGLVDPTKTSAGSPTNAAPFKSSIPSSRGSVSGSGTPLSGSGSAAALASTASDDAKIKADASLKVASIGSGETYKSGSGSAGLHSSDRSADSLDGGAAATAGSASEGAAFGEAGKSGSGAMTADGQLIVEDPANYFMMSDMDVSLFKRVTLQCRKKERSLVLAP
jgi:hypothetical protein